MPADAPAAPPAPFDLARARVCAILNPGSGRKAAPEIEALLRERLQPRVAALELRPCAEGSRLADMAKQAVRDGFDVILASGGDGTQAAVAGALAGTDAAMGVIPSGTFNYFARELGAGETPEAAIDALATAVPRRVDLADINGRVFLVNVSFGIYPEILKTREDIYHRWGRSRLAAYWAVLVALRNLAQPLRLTLRAEGEARQVTTPLAFVARNALQLEGFGIDAAEAVREGKLALLTARAHTARGLVGSALRLAFGRGTAGDDFDLVVTDEVTIETRPARQAVAYDGERQRMTGPFTITMRPGALTVLVPPTQDAPGPAA